MTPHNLKPLKRLFFELLSNLMDFELPNFNRFRTERKYVIIIGLGG